MNSAEPKSEHACAVCLTRGEVILSVFVFAIGVGVSTLHEVMFGNAGLGRVLSTVLDAIQGSLFWSAVLIGLRRLSIRVYSGFRSRMLRRSA
jgi:hypothetical protein